MSNNTPGCSGYESGLSRRDLLSRFGTGLSGIALAILTAQDSASPTPNTQHPTPNPHARPRAPRSNQVFSQSGVKQVRPFDYRPELLKYHGKSMPAGKSPDAFFGKVGLLHQPHWQFKQRGKSGLWISDLFPQIAGMADELTLIRSMWAGTGNHTPATYEANSGFRTLGFPSAGSWISYGLGSEAQNLPAFVVMPDSRGVPTGGANNWTSGFLPARHQGVMFNARGPAIRDLQPSPDVSAQTQSARFEAIKELNRRHLRERHDEDALAARIHSYELAARMQ